MSLNDTVRSFWEREACGTGNIITGNLEPGSEEWFRQIEQHRYEAEPFIHSIAQFTRHHGKKILEVGVGAGTDHLQWARAGCECHGVDLTDAAIETTRKHLALYGLKSDLKRINAQELPYADESFDIVYSWGVIHHAEQPEYIIGEILRVLRPGGMFIGMMYGRRSPAVFKLWVRHGLFRGRPFRSWRDLVWNHVESLGTKAYTISELSQLFGAYSEVSFKPLITPYDTSRWPRWISRFFPDDWGWFITIRAKR